MKKYSGNSAAAEIASIISLLIKGSYGSPWGVRTCSPVSLIKEITRACEVAVVAPSAAKALPHLKLELTNVLKKDPVSHSKYPDVLLQVDAIDITKHNVSLVNSHFQMILSKIDDYRVSAKEIISSCLDEKVEYTWSELYEIIQNLLSHLNYIGVSQEFIRRAARDYLNTGDTPNAEDLRVLIDSCSQKSKHFECWARVNWPHPGVGQQPFEKQNIEIQSELPEITSVDVQRFIERVKDTTGLILACKIKARDHYAARDKFIGILANAFSYVNFYSQHSRNSIGGNVVLVRQIDDNDSHCLKSTTSYAIPPVSVKDVGAKLFRLFKAREKLSYIDRRRIDASFQYHSLALSSTASESQLINLWISLESLVDTENTSVVESVSKHVSNLAALSYIYKTTRSLARNIVRLDCYRSDIMPLFEDASKYKLPSKSLLSLLCSNKSDEYQKLIDATSEHGNVCGRIDFLSNTTLGDPKDLLKRLIRERQRVEWQVRRIFRERNEIAHRGEASPMLNSLLSHLFQYQFIVLKTLVQDIHKYGGKLSLSQCVYFRQSCWVTLEKSLNSRADLITVEKLIDPSIDDFSGKQIDNWL